MRPRCHEEVEGRSFTGEVAEGIATQRAGSVAELAATLYHKLLLSL